MRGLHDVEKVPDHAMPFPPVLPYDVFIFDHTILHQNHTLFIIMSTYDHFRPGRQPVRLAVSPTSALTIGSTASASGKTSSCTNSPLYTK